MNLSVRAVPPRSPLVASRQILEWSTQQWQYPPIGRPGLSYFPGVTPLGTIDCLLWRNEAGELIGILNHYPFRTAEGQEPGSINIWVHPEWQRRGVATRLIEEADRRWQLDFNAQSLTPAGVRWLHHVMRKHDIHVHEFTVHSS